MSLDLNFTAYNEDMVIVGMKGSGKSYLANEILRGLKNIPVIVYDFNSQFHDSHAVVLHEIKEVFTVFDAGQKHIIFQPFNKNEETFVKYCDEIFKRSNVVAMIDETHVYVSKQKILKSYNNLILSGRPRGISVISISSRPANLPNNALTNARHIFAFKLNLESDIIFLESWLGSQAWELLPQAQRKKNQDAPELPEHSFYYRDTLAPSGVVGKI
jgi:DNA helicase HerA-like ATPase